MPPSREPLDSLQFLHEVPFPCIWIRLYVATWIGIAQRICQLAKNSVFVVERFDLSAIQKWCGSGYHFGRRSRGLTYLGFLSVTATEFKALSLESLKHVGEV